MVAATHTQRADAQTALSVAKFLKIFGWILISMGILLSLTLIGAIIGLPMIFGGCLMVFFFSRMFKKRANAMLQDIEESEYARQ